MIELSISRGLACPLPPRVFLVLLKCYGVFPHLLAVPGQINSNSGSVSMVIQCND